MTCHDALERLLVADLSTDGSVDDPVLNSHLKHCAQCSAVASQLRSDTRLLAAAVVSPRELRSPVGAPRRLSFALPVLAVAAIAVFVVARSRPSDGSGTLVATSVAGAVADASERPTQTAEGARGVSQPSPNVPRRVTSARRTQESPRVVAASLGDDLRRAITPFTATPFVPERTFVAAAALETPQPVNHADAARVPVFSVDPMVGTRAMVARTADPRITVVWLY